MPSKRMLPHSVTLFNYAGEADYEAEYCVTILENVLCITKEGIVFSVSGTNSNNDADLYIFERNSIAKDQNGNIKQYMPPNEWDNCENKAAYWTLHNDGTDSFIKGVNNELTIPPEEALSINGVVYCNEVGSPRMRHWEVYAR